MRPSKPAVGVGKHGSPRLDQPIRTNRLWGVVCGVWCVVCGVWCVVCGVWCVVCGVWGVGCGVWGDVATAISWIRGRLWPGVALQRHPRPHFAAALSGASRHSYPRSMWLAWTTAATLHRAVAMRRSRLTFVTRAAATPDAMVSGWMVSLSLSVQALVTQLG